LSFFFSSADSASLRSAVGGTAVFVADLDLALVGIPDKSALQIGHSFDPFEIRSLQDGHSILAVLLSFFPQLGHALGRPVMSTPQAGQRRFFVSGEVMVSKQTPKPGRDVRYCVPRRNVPCAGI
jgi:hypothetical protein